MGAEIERIVDRKTVRNRVQYLVVWRGFGEESNTWESRMDLVADGYSDVIRAYENSRKDADHAADSSSASSSRSPSRGRSPGRSSAKSAASSTASSSSSSSSTKTTSKSPARGRGRPRSNSTGRSPSATRRRSSSKSREASANGNGTDSEAASSSGSRRRSSRKQEKAAAPVEVKPDADADSDELLRKTLAALEQAPRVPSPSASKAEAAASASVQLAYEDAPAVAATEAAAPAPASPSKPAKPLEGDEAAAGLQDLWQRLNEGNWLLWFLSVVVVAASLLASQLLPSAEDAEDGGLAPGGRDVEAGSSQWRQWLPFLTPTIALLLVLHQRDARALVKWVAIALAWRVAAELSIFFEFAQVAIGAATVSYTALVVALVAIARTDDLRSKSTLAVFVVGALALALSDSWIVQTQNVALSSRVSLMSASALAIALSPVLTATAEED